ncbi:MAG: NigD1/NigD2 family lipoprotein [Bacteroidaceae bacterium]
MKRISTIIVSVIAIFMTVSSCREDRDKIETMMSGYMTGYTDSEGYFTVLNDDMGNQYMVSEQDKKHQPDTLLRVVATIALDERNTARIIQCVFPIANRAREDSSLHDTLKKADPVEIQSLYIGGGFLNVNLGIRVQTEGTKHTIVYSYADDSDKLRFTIYHNAYDDKPVYTKKAYLSIPLSEYGLNKNDTVFLNCKGYEEDYEYKLIYK